MKSGITEPMFAKEIFDEQGPRLKSYIVTAPQVLPWGKMRRSND